MKYKYSITWTSGCEVEADDDKEAIALAKDWFDDMSSSDHDFQIESKTEIESEEDPDSEFNARVDFEQDKLR